MKSISFIILFIFSAGCLLSQNKLTDTLEFAQFSKAQFSTWDSIEKNWDKTFFGPFLKKNKIKISCAKCTGVTAIMALAIHEDGHCHPKFIKGRKCAFEYTKQQINEIEKSFMLITFPPEFYNTIIKVRLGRVLKC